MTAQDRDTATEAMSLATRALMADRDRFSLLHGDYRLDNLLLDPDRTRVTASPAPACFQTNGRWPTTTW